MGRSSELYIHGHKNKKPRNTANVNTFDSVKAKTVLVFSNIMQVPPLLLNTHIHLPNMHIHLLHSQIQNIAK